MGTACLCDAADGVEGFGCSHANESAVEGPAAGSDESEELGYGVIEVGREVGGKTSNPVEFCQQQRHITSLKSIYKFGPAHVPNVGRPGINLEAFAALIDRVEINADQPILVFFLPKMYVIGMSVVAHVVKTSYITIAS